MLSNTFLGTIPLIFLRISLFFSCRIILLRSLYHDLQGLSGVSFSSGPRLNGHTNFSGTSEIEMETLPVPSTQPLRLKDTSIHSTLARTTFGICFSESCSMFFILILQAFDVFTPRTRLVNWRISLFVLLATILVLIPLFVSLTLTLGTNMGADLHKHSLIPRVILSLIPVILYLFALSYIPLPLALSSSDLMTTALSRLVVLGTIVLGLLSGFGAISNAWAFLSTRTGSEPSDQEIASAEQALNRIRTDLQDRQAETKRRDASKPQGEGSWLSRVVPTFRGDDNLQEIKGLEALEYQMARNVDTLRERRASAKIARTFRGRILNWSGRLFAVYCIIRVISSIINIFSPKSPSTTTYPDVITRLLAYFFSFVSPGDTNVADVATISRQISLGLVGVIILTSIRLVLRGVTRALKVTSRNLGASLMLFLLAQVMGIYLLSTIVQLRSAFPPPSNEPDPSADAVTGNLFSTIPEYQVFGSLFDWSFLIAAATSVFIRWGAEKIGALAED